MAAGDLGFTPVSNEFLPEILSSGWGFEAGDDGDSSRGKGIFFLTILILLDFNGPVAKLSSNRDR